MHPRNIAAGALIVFGALGLGYGGLGYAESDPSGSAVQLSIDDREFANVPVWAGAAAIVLMLVSRRRS